MHSLYPQGNTLIVWGGWDGAKDKVLKSVYSFDLAEFVKPKGECHLALLEPLILLISLEPEEEMPYK